MRCLPITVPPAQHEIVASYLARLATLHGLDGDELWKQVSVPRSHRRSGRIVVPDRLAALTGRPVELLAAALVELRPQPDWQALRHTPQPGCPRCAARHPEGPIIQLLPHHRYVCTRHRHWIGPPDVHQRGPILDDLPDIVRAQHRHQRLVHRRGWLTTYGALLIGFVICARTWIPGNTDNRCRTWERRAHILIPPGTEATTFSPSRLFAAIYPEAVDIAAILTSTNWRQVVIENTHRQQHVAAEIGRRISHPNYYPYQPPQSDDDQPPTDPIMRWIQPDGGKLPIRPPALFTPARIRRPSRVNATKRAMLRGHDNRVHWFARDRDPRHALLGHQHLRPALTIPSVISPIRAAR
ncbi:TniQ family protein [Parafrankia sp. FMc6]|uniref:TniQ family protein n=1 Tax=Parafrankia soli TaxID=2599596 RepID=UPI0034D4F37C